MLTLYNRYPLKWTLDTPHGPSGRSGKDKMSFHARIRTPDRSGPGQVTTNNINFTGSTFSALFVCFWRDSPQRARASSFTRFLDHTQRRITVGRTPLDEWSARRRDLYLTTHNHSQQTNIHAPGGILTHNLSRRAAADPRLRQRGHWDRHIPCLNQVNTMSWPTNAQ